MQRGRLQVVDGIDRRIPRHEHPHNVEMALLAGPVEGGVVVAVALVDVSVVVDVLQQRVQVALRKGFRKKEGRGDYDSDSNKHLHIIYTVYSIYSRMSNNIY